MTLILCQYGISIRWKLLQTFKRNIFLDVRRNSVNGDHRSLCLRWTTQDHVDKRGHWPVIMPQERTQLQERTVVTRRVNQIQIK
jgi:hypothetical protein